MKISVIIPVYNVEKFLKKCLDSIINQTYKNLRVILVDDGSTDKSGEICDKYAEMYNFIDVFHKENGGLVSAWKYGFEKSDTEYISFIDPDDWISLNYYETLVKELSNTKAEIITSRVAVISDNKLVKELDYSNLEGFYSKNTFKKYIKDELLNQGGFMDRKLPITRWAKVIKRELLVDKLLYVDDEVTYGEDLNIMYPVIMEARSIYISQDGNAKYFYRIRKDSMQHSYDKNKVHSVIKVYSSLNKYCKEYNIDTKQIYTDYFCAVVQCYKNELNVRSYKKALQNINKLISKSYFIEGYSLTKNNKFGLLNRLITFSINNKGILSRFSYGFLSMLMKIRR